MSSTPISGAPKTFLLKFPCAILLMHQTSKMALVVSEGEQYDQGEDFDFFEDINKQSV